MMERTPTTYNFKKKITAYLDGSLSPEERSEFEAFVHTHPEFETIVKNKEEELQVLRGLIPAMGPSPEIQDSLENEMKVSVFNLLKEEPKGFWDSLQNNFEEWLSR